MTKAEHIFLSSLVSILIGIVLGTLVASFSGIISDNFRSATYVTTGQSEKYTLGIVLGYGVLYGAVLSGLLYMKLKSNVYFSFVTAVIAVGLVAIWWRGLSSLGNLDCGYECVDTIFPLSANEAATAGVRVALAAVGTLFVIIYFMVRNKTK
jgi:hypothetical protein